MGYLDNLAKSLIGTTLVPSQETKGSAALSGAVTQFGKEFQKELEPFRKQKKTDIIGHEYAADPYRLDLTKKFAAIGGNKSWGILASDLEKARDAVLNYKKQVATKIAEEPVATDVAPKVFQLKDLEKKETKKIGNYIVGRRSDDKYIYKKVGDKGYSLDNKLGTKITGLNILESAPVVRPKVKKTDERKKDFKTLDELEHNLKVLEKKFNSIVPGRSEIEKLYNTQLQLFGKLTPRGGGLGGKRKDRRYELQYKEYMKQAKDDVTKMQKMGLFKDVDSHVINSAIVDLCATADDDTVASGKIFAVKNSLINHLRDMDEGEIDNILKRNDIKVAKFTEMMNDPKNKTKPIKKEMFKYLILSTMAGFGVEGVSDKRILELLAGDLGEKAFRDSGASLINYHGKPRDRFVKDFKVMIDSRFKQKVGPNYKEKLAKKGQMRFHEYTKSLGVNPEWKTALTEFAMVMTHGMSKNVIDITRPENIRKEIRKKITTDWRSYKDNKDIEGVKLWNMLNEYSRGY